MKKQTRRLSFRSFPAILLLVAIGGQLQAQVLTTLVTFNGRNGTSPEAPPIQGTDGNFYGTTSRGGLPVNAAEGTVFMMSPAWQVTTLYSFSLDGPTGALPLASLTEGSDGNFYGSTSTAGPGGGGTIFSITPAGALTTLCRFGFSGDANGAGPESALVQGADGNFYGTTYAGGLHNIGTVFKVLPGGGCSTLYQFGITNADGARPYGGLAKGPDGNFYGTTQTGGLYNQGTIFRITSGGAMTTLYHLGTAPGDGSESTAAMILGTDGNFYGSTQIGGVNVCGTIFRFTLSGLFTTIHSFTCAEGGNPASPLVQGSDGTLYGTSHQSNGALFSVTLAGAATKLYTFCSLPSCNDGSATSGVIQASDGSLYGATGNVEPNNSGTIFRFSFPASPPSITPGGVVPVYSSVPSVQSGEWFSIYGSNLANSTMSWNGDFPTSLGGTSVTIDGKSAYLWFVSRGQINLQVPDDLNLGSVPVVVTTAGGKATSSVTLAQFAPSFSLVDNKHVAGIVVTPDGSRACGLRRDLQHHRAHRNLARIPNRCRQPGDSLSLFAVGLGPVNSAVLAWPRCSPVWRRQRMR